MVMVRVMVMVMVMLTVMRVRTDASPRGGGRVRVKPKHFGASASALDEGRKGVEKVLKVLLQLTLVAGVSAFGRQIIVSSWRCAPDSTASRSHLVHHEGYEHARRYVLGRGRLLQETAAWRWGQKRFGRCDRVCEQLWSQHPPCRARTCRTAAETRGCRCR